MLVYCPAVYRYRRSREAVLRRIHFNEGCGWAGDRESLALDCVAVPIKRSSTRDEFVTSWSDKDFTELKMPVGVARSRGNADAIDEEFDICPKRHEAAYARRGVRLKRAHIEADDSLKPFG
jgi:hypothetical protein